MKMHRKTKVHCFIRTDDSMETASMMLVLQQLYFLAQHNSIDPTNSSLLSRSFFCCLHISVNVHSWTLLEMLSAGSPLTVHCDWNQSIHNNGIIDHCPGFFFLFFSSCSVTALKATAAVRNISVKDKQSLSQWKARSAFAFTLWCLICFFSPTALQSTADLQAKTLSWWEEAVSSVMHSSCFIN